MVEKARGSVPNQSKPNWFLAWCQQVPAVVWVLFGIGLALRLNGIGFGMPYPDARPDETGVIRIALRFGSGDLNPHYFHYPALYMYVLFFAYGAYYAVGRITGQFHAASDLVAQYFNDSSVFHLISRGISASFGAATIVVAYLVGNKLRNRRTGIAYAFFMAIAYLHVRDSHFGVTDVPVTFFATVATYYLITCTTEGTVRAFALFGVFAGLCQATKYLGVFFVPAAVLAHFVGPSDLTVPPIRRFRRLLIFGMSFVGVFLAINPFTLLDFHTFIADFLSEARAVNVAKDQIGWIYDARFSLGLGIGFAMLLLAPIGWAVEVRRNWRVTLPLLSFYIFYFLVAGSGYRLYVRYMIPMVPAFALGAGILLDFLSSVLARGVGPQSLATFSPYALAGLLGAESIDRDVYLETLLPRQDTRVDALRWTKSNLPEGTTICETAGVGSLELPWSVPLIESRLEAGGLDAASTTGLRMMLNARRASKTPGYAMWRFDDETRGFEAAHHPVAGLPEYVFIERNPKLGTVPTPPWADPLVARCYDLVTKFDAMDLTDDRNVFDYYDAFFFPYAGFNGVQRPGPNIEIYKRSGPRCDDNGILASKPAKVGL